VVTTWMGDCLRTGKLSQYITNHPGQLSFRFLRGSGVSKSSTDLLGLGLRGACLTVRWQATVCDFIWQVTLRSFATNYH